MNRSWFCEQVLLLLQSTAGLITGTESLFADTAPLGACSCNSSALTGHERMSTAMIVFFVFIFLL